MRVILFCVILWLALPLTATDYYVANTRSSNGDGSLANPWKDYSDINWGTIFTALQSASVNLYFSSRDIWPQAQNITPCTGSASKPLRIVADEKYTTDASGTASWSTDTTGSRGILTNNTGSQVGGFAITNGVSYVSISGFQIKRAFVGVGGNDNPQTNIHHLTVSNCWMFGQPDITSYGIGFVFAEAGCSNFTFSHCVISNTQLEAIYLGHFDYAPRTITDNLIEYNLIIDTGLNGEGEIDVKNPCKRTIVRYNTGWRRAGITGGCQSGVVMGSDDFQIYGNYWTNMFQKVSDQDFGYGIYVNADDGIGITNGLIYNNVLFGNGSAGIRLLGSVAAMSGIKVWNNTIAYNRRLGLEMRSAGGQSITLAQLTNNLFLENTSNDLSLENTDCHVTAANYNLMYRASGNVVDYQGTGKTFAQWKALGYDANGLNVDPLLWPNFYTKPESPARNAGANLSALFTVDRDGTTRTVPWTIGAYHLDQPPADQPTITGPVNIRSWRHK